MGARWTSLPLAAALVLALAAGCSDAPTEDPADGVADTDEPPAEDAPDADDDPGDDAGPSDDGVEDAEEDQDDPGAAEEPDPASEEVRRPVAPMRAVWVHLFDDRLKSTDGIARLVEELEAAGADTVLAQVARRHDAYYDAEVLPRTADPDLPAGHDVLAELTQRAGEAGIAVHAWVSVAPTWHRVYEDLPAPDGWLPAAHGRDAPTDDRWVSRTVDGTWTEYLDPALPEVRAHVADLVTELAATGVDGIHLDYVRYESERSGYHPRALERYQAETGTAGTPAPDDPAWSQWRRDQTTAVVAAAREALDATGTGVALSAAVITWGPGPSEAGGFEATRTATEALQDWPQWVEEGLVDVALPMNYFREHDDEQAGWFADWLAFQSDLAAGADALVVPGIGGWLQQSGGTTAQVAAAMETTDGAAIYSYQQPTDGADGDLATARIRPYWSELADQGWPDVDEG